MSFDWKKTLATVAPGIAGALGGPLAGYAVGVAASALGLDDGASEQQIAERVMSGNPQVLVQLRQAENDFKIKMREAGIDLERVHADDRASARDMAKTLGAWPQVILSAIYTYGYFWLLHALVTKEVTIPQDLMVLVTTLVGVLTAAQVQIMNFWFGSSAGSKQKTQELAHSFHNGGKWPT